MQFRKQLIFENNKYKLFGLSIITDFASSFADFEALGKSSIDQKSLRHPQLKERSTHTRLKTSLWQNSF